MKKFLIVTVCAFFIMTVLPVICVKSEVNGKVLTVSTQKIKEKATAKTKTQDYLNIKITESGKIEKISVKDYLFGCVASEMPINYESEALKAQCIAAHTFALRRKENSKNNYDITDDYRVDQCYMGKKKIKEKWGENWDENSKKLEKIINETKDFILTYDGKTALTVYHAVSNGKTLNSSEVWGNDLPYLTSVDSSFDRLCDSYKTQKTVSFSEFKKIFEKAEKLTGFKIEKTKNGRVEYVDFSSVKINGSDIAEKLNLRSSSFDIKNENENLVFTVYGYGHGVGMSQNGANYMAKNGSDFKEILFHYYKGCKLKKIS